MSNKYHLPRGTSADGPYDVLVTPESAGWGYAGLRILTLQPGEAHALSTHDSEFLVLPLTGSCTVTTDGASFELEGRTGGFASVTDFAHLPPESAALISSAQGGLFALPSARTERSSLSARYGPKEAVPVELRGAGACSRHVMAGPGQDRAWLICDDPAHGWVRTTWESQDIDDRLPFEGLTQR
ncbi:MAG: 5-deoxy-glucuronate isomerase [Streptomyces sp.]|uniref:5-deoxy-glucuronate isomerase n=1 Tax=Streptomyces sp. TaxID=1931 RepID=UPI0025ECC807|nr:5-deoxy-glucuronate isomerase [Streptomyces sp.]MBW8795225.1 5-deoxy-glucuronate isomerase [Streptomyces sp.]